MNKEQREKLKAWALGAKYPMMAVPREDIIGLLTVISNLEIELDHAASARCQDHEDGVQEERVHVVEWLKDMGDSYYADCIERGEHLEEKKKDE